MTADEHWERRYWAELDELESEQAVEELNDAQWDDTVRSAVDCLLDEHYPLAVDERGQRLLGVGVDVLTSIGNECLGCERVFHDHGDRFEFALTEQAEEQLHHVLAAEWRDIAAEHRHSRPTVIVRVPHAVPRARSPRPRARRGSRAVARAGPDDDSGEPEPPGVAPGGASRTTDLPLVQRAVADTGSPRACWAWSRRAVVWFGMRWLVAARKAAS